MIHGAVHMPDSTFGADAILSLLARANMGRGEADAPAEGPVLIVFHCMESARRGPRCARRVIMALEARAEMDSDGDGTEAAATASAAAGANHPPEVQVRVLAGGFDQWVRRYWKDATKVQGYDDEYWGFTEFDPAGEVAEEDAEEAARQLPAAASRAAGPAHPLYSRPADQPATPWSEAGSPKAL